MVGEFEDNNLKGIIPRAFDYIFEKIKTSQQGDKSSKYSVSIAFIQIYLETIQDLFEPSIDFRGIPGVVRPWGLSHFIFS